MCILFLLFLQPSRSNQPQDLQDDKTVPEDQALKPNTRQITNFGKNPESQEESPGPEAQVTQRRSTWSSSRTTTTLSRSLTTLSKATTRSSRRHLTGRHSRVNSGGELLSSENMKRFRRKIHSSLELKDDDSSRFLAESQLKELICQPTVANFLEQDGSASSTDLDKTELAAFICSRARRIFAILVWAERENQIEQFYKNGFTDEMLPVKVKSRDDEEWTVESLVTNCTNSKAVSTTFSSWRDSEIDYFCDHNQWLFLAPVLSEEKFQHRFHEKTRMPFLDLKRMNESNFSIVWEGHIHIDHLRLRDGSHNVSYT